MFGSGEICNLQQVLCKMHEPTRMHGDFVGAKVIICSSPWFVHFPWLEIIEVVGTLCQ